MKRATYGQARKPRTRTTKTRAELDWEREKNAIWAAMNGCDCPVSYKDKAGKTIIVKKTDRCTEKIIRCNGRIRLIQTRLKKLGPCPTPKEKT